MILYTRLYIILILETYTLNFPRRIWRLHIFVRQRIKRSWI